MHEKTLSVTSLFKCHHQYTLAHYDEETCVLMLAVRYRKHYWHDRLTCPVETYKDMRNPKVKDCEDILHQLKMTILWTPGSCHYDKLFMDCWRKNFHQKRTSGRHWQGKLHTQSWERQGMILWMSSNLMKLSIMEFMGREWLN